MWPDSVLEAPITERAGGGSGERKTSHRSQRAHVESTFLEALTLESKERGAEKKISRYCGNKTRGVPRATRQQPVLQSPGNLVSQVAGQLGLRAKFPRGRPQGGARLGSERVVRGICEGVEVVNLLRFIA